MKQVAKTHLRQQGENFEGVRANRVEPQIHLGKVRYCWGRCVNGDNRKRDVKRRDGV